MAVGSSSNNNKKKAIRRAAWKMAKPMVEVDKRPGKTPVLVYKIGNRRHLAIVKSSTKPDPKALPPKKKRT
jgi:hypothetical protein